MGKDKRGGSFEYFQLTKIQIRDSLLSIIESAVFQAQLEEKEEHPIIRNLLKGLDVIRACIEGQLEIRPKDKHLLAEKAGVNFQISKLTEALNTEKRLDYKSLGNFLIKLK